MHAFFPAALVLTLLEFEMGKARADEQAKSIIEKAIKAVGGEEALKRHSAYTWSEKGTYYGMGDGLPYTGSYALELPDRFRMQIEGAFTIVVNGNKGWVNDQELTSEQMKDRKDGLRAYHLYRLYPLLKAGITLTCIGDSQSDGRTLVGVKVSQAGEKDITLFFDKDTGLHIKTVRRVRSDEMNGKEVEEQATILDHKIYDGLKVGSRFVILHDGKKFVEAEITDYKRTDQLDDKLFQKP